MTCWKVGEKSGFSCFKCFDQSTIPSSFCFSRSLVSACTSACGRPAESISQQRHKLVATSAAWGDLKVREIVRFAKEICDVYALALKYRFDVFQQLHAILWLLNLSSSRGHPRHGSRRGICVSARLHVYARSFRLHHLRGEPPRGILLALACVASLLAVVDCAASGELPMSPLGLQGCSRHASMRRAGLLWPSTSCVTQLFAPLIVVYHGTDQYQGSMRGTS